MPAVDPLLRLSYIPAEGIPWAVRLHYQTSPPSHHDGISVPSEVWNLGHVLSLNYTAHRRDDTVPGIEPSTCPSLGKETPVVPSPRRELGAKKVEEK